MSSQSWIGQRVAFECRVTADSCTAVVYSYAPHRWFVHYRGDLQSATQAAVGVILAERPSGIWLPQSTSESLATADPRRRDRLEAVLAAACDAVDAGLHHASPTTDYCSAVR